MPWTGGSAVPWTGGSAVPWTGGSAVPWTGGSAVPWTGGSAVPWTGGSAVPWTGGSAVPWTGGSAVPWTGGSAVPWTGGSAVPWTGGSAVPWTGGSAVPWTGGSAVPWTGGSAVPWTGGSAVPWTGGSAVRVGGRRSVRGRVMAPDRPSGLAGAAVACGEPVEVGSKEPVRLDDPQVAWFVERGGLDVFLLEHADGETVSSPSHMLRVGSGGLAFGLPETPAPLIGVARVLPGSKLHRVRLSELLDRVRGGDVVDQIDAWVSDFSAAVARKIEPRPRPDLLLDTGEARRAPVASAGRVVSVRSGAGVCWVAAESGAAIAYLGTENPESTGTGRVPLTSETWMTLQSVTAIEGVSSLDLHREGRLPDALAEFHGLALAAEHFNRLLLLADEVNEQTAQASHRRLDEELARRSLFNILSPARPTAEQAGSTLLAALELVGAHEGIEFRPAPRQRTAAGEEPALAEILEASGVRGRKVRLTAEDRWWLGDSGAMLGSRAADGRPVALLPGGAGRYRAVDPVSGRAQRVNAGRAAEFDGDAWCFYRPLPEGRAVTARDLVRLAGKGMLGDFARLVCAGLLASVLSLVPSIAVGTLAGWVLPSGAGAMLVQIVIALVVLAVVGVLLQALQGTAMMRIEGRATARVVAALWDRLLGLPTPFFKGFTSGNLATRLAALQLLRDQVSGVVSHALFSFVFLVPTLGLLFFYDVTLAWVSASAGIVALLVTAVLGALQIRPQRRRYRAARNLTGELLQFINGMGKLRSAGAEASAFASWARGYREQHLAGIQINRLNEHLVAFSAAVPALSGAALFAAALWRGDERLALEDFLVVYAVSMTFYFTVTGLGRSFEVIAAALPAIEQVAPVLAAVPESRMEGTAPAVLGGEIRFDRVSFRYSDDGPLIVDDVSIHARPGEFIAVVGESGAGKSTLLRLALGLEDPSAGGVYYDGRELANLDRRSVRRQVGVVMQSGALQPGDILDNIIGVAGDLTIDDAWRAARLAAVDQDLEAMPMGMFTAVTDSSSTFSGGQIQRIRIAAALVRNPRIVLLDEATNWLDTKNQADVMAGIETLSATRVVIAHRLSTIRKAERIYVLEAGRVAQHGSFEELFAVDGPFRRLVQRQTD